MGLGAGLGREEEHSFQEKLSQIFAWVACPKDESTLYEEWGFAHKEVSQTQGG